VFKSSCSLVIVCILKLSFVICRILKALWSYVCLFLSRPIHQVRVSPQNVKIVLPSLYICSLKRSYVTMWCKIVVKLLKHTFSQYPYFGSEKKTIYLVSMSGSTESLFFSHDLLPRLLGVNGTILLRVVCYNSLYRKHSLVS